jgi:hypothetical protein
MCSSASANIPSTTSGLAAVAHRPKARRARTPGGVSAATAVSKLPHVAAVIDAGGEIMLGTVKPLSGAAVAHDGHKTLAMLRRRPAEALEDLLLRLDVAIATAQSSGSRVDEINKSSSDVRYEL